MLLSKMLKNYNRGVKMAKFVNQFKEHRKGKQALEVKGSIMRNDYPTIDDLRVLFIFQEQADKETFKWKEQAKISLNVNEVFQLLSMMQLINKERAPDYKYWKTYHPSNDVNKNLSLLKKGKYVVLQYNDEKTNVNISFETGCQVSQFIEKVKLLVYTEQNNAIIN